MEIKVENAINFSILNYQTNHCTGAILIKTPFSVCPNAHFDKTYG